MGLDLFDVDGFDDLMPGRRPRSQWEELAERYHDPNRPPPDAKEWGDYCAHMEWLGDQISDLETEVRELRRVGPASELWTQARRAVERAVASTTPEVVDATSREVQRRAVAALDELARMADIAERNGRSPYSVTRFRWCLQAVRHAIAHYPREENA